jgi:hypothetical protein
MAELADIEKKAKAHQKLVDAGEASWEDFDEDGNSIGSYGEHLGEIAYESEQVLNIVRMAFTISLNHFVEVQIGEKLNGKYTQAKAFAWLKSQGWTPDEERLNELRHAANCAKHGGTQSASQLYPLRPDLFDRDKIEGWGADPSYDNLVIKDEHLQSFFEAVRNSVPQLPFAWH